MPTHVKKKYASNYPDITKGIHGVGIGGKPLAVVEELAAAAPLFVSTIHGSGN